MSVVTRIRTSQELTVPFAPEEVWTVLADVVAYPEWWPAKLRVEILHHPGELLGAEFEVRPVMGRMFRIRFEELEGMRSMRLRFFGGSLEGPGGFHLQALDGATQVRYEMDVFARGLDVAVLSQVLPLERIHQSRMRSVLRSLAARLKTLRRAADRLASREARSIDREAAIRRQAEEEAAVRLAEEAARRQAERDAAARAAAEEAERRAAEEEAAARLAAEEAERRASEEEAAHRDAEAEARKQAEAEEAARRAAEEAERRAEREAAARAVAHEATPDVSGELDHVAAEQRATGSRPRPLWGRIANWLREAPAAPTLSAPAEEPANRPAPGPGLSNFDIARLYLEALSARATPEEIGQFFSSEATQEEFPHRFLAATARRGFAGIIEARSNALARFGPQRYELSGATGGGSQVAMEVRWKGSVATTGGGFTVGQELDARLAVFLKFADGKIVRERTYACFEPWSTRAERLVTLDERVAQAGQSTQAPARGPADVPMEPVGSNFEIARSYLDALGARGDAEAIARFHAADAVQDEFPNRFLQGGAHRDLQAIKLARSRGLALMASESYELLGATGGGSQVALEVAWSGVVGEGLGLFAAGHRLEARLGIFLKFRDGLIVAQRNYTCAPLERQDGSG